VVVVGSRGLWIRHGHGVPVVRGGHWHLLWHDHLEPNAQLWYHHPWLQAFHVVLYVPLVVVAAAVVVVEEVVVAHSWGAG
jgi:hypothetical protein